jgi:hypothetical protein
MNTETKSSQLSKDCQNFREKLPDLLLEEGYAAAHPEWALHSADCPPCLEELTSLQQTMAVLSEFKAPEPSPYFDTRLHARLREAETAAPEGFWERIRSFVQFSTGRSFRPAVAGALAAVLVLGGGGTFLQMHHNPVTEASSAVNDLKVLDNNEQAEQQMGQLLDLSGSEDGDAQPAS